jgi:hypothetical protein
MEIFVKETLLMRDQVNLELCINCSPPLVFTFEFLQSAVLYNPSGFLRPLVWDRMNSVPYSNLNYFACVYTRGLKPDNLIVIWSQLTTRIPAWTNEMRLICVQLKTRQLSCERNVQKYEQTYLKFSQQHSQFVVASSVVL